MIDKYGMLQPPADMLNRFIMNTADDNDTIQFPKDMFLKGAEMNRICNENFLFKAFLFNPFPNGRKIRVLPFLIRGQTAQHTDQRLGPLFCPRAFRRLATV